MSNPIRNLYLSLGHLKRWRISATTARITAKNLIILLLLFSLISYLWLLFGNIQPAHYSNLRVTTSSPQAGQTLRYQLYRCRYVGSSVSALAIVTLVPQHNRNLLPITISNNRGANGQGCNEIQREVALPSSLPGGWYTLHIVGIYTILPIRNVSEQIGSKPFYISPADTKQKIIQMQGELNTLQQQLDLLRANASSLTPALAAPDNSVAYSAPPSDITGAAPAPAPAPAPSSATPPPASTTPSRRTPPPSSAGGTGSPLPPTNPGPVQDILHFLF